MTVRFPASTVDRKRRRCERSRKRARRVPLHRRSARTAFGVRPCSACDEPMIRMPNERRSLTLDHVIPSSRGGSNHLSNLVGACAECNQDKGSLTGEEYAAVLNVRRSKKGSR
jgi:5-methylcytosine-specific restriction endonuclease McrA